MSDDRLFQNMKHRQEDLVQPGILRYQSGETVRIVQGNDCGKTGEIVEIDPTQDEPYVVKVTEGWSGHYPEDHLAPVTADGP